MRDPVVTVMGMAPEIAVEVIAHVNQFFGDHDLQRLRLRHIYPVEIDQDGVHPVSLEETVGSTISGRDMSPQPLPVHLAVTCDPKIFARKCQPIEIAFNEAHDVGGTRLSAQSNSM
jgi:hypothetical protein